MIQSETITIPRSFEERRIAQFETDEVPQYRTVIRAIDMSALSPADVKALDDLTTAFGCQTAYFLQLFLRGEYRRFCQGNRYFP